MPAKPGIAKDLIQADDIGRKAVADFIDSLLDLKKSVFHNPVKKKLSNLQNVNSQMRA